MKILRINHLGIASPTLDEAMGRMGRLFGMEADHVEEVAEQRVRTAFFPVGPSTLEYLEATDPEGPVGKFLEKKGPGIHHVAFEVDDVDAAVEELLAKGVRMIDTSPRPGAHGCRIAFIHPAETGGVLMELCQSPRA
ncbi:methylmalonyl-CoA epimerase [Mesoterricola silvestris]|uniref:Methylmalonyl-CoA epimerase n=1 Tax=Mesoterricola silvestris TaxID=2927979 RepID=A0AA48KDT9_9BACT|nr:methylmalonyl-CoA epimerase [Mesoterricola silvestris]BDU74783.1 methylmalonyl-CoA epimerase [Mesoterricola silvestris]